MLNGPKMDVTVRRNGTGIGIGKTQKRSENDSIPYFEV